MNKNFDLTKLPKPWDFGLYPAMNLLKGLCYENPTTVRKVFCPEPVKKWIPILIEGKFKKKPIYLCTGEEAVFMVLLAPISEEDKTNAVEYLELDSNLEDDRFFVAWRGESNSKEKSLDNKIKKLMKKYLSKLDAEKFDFMSITNICDDYMFMTPVRVYNCLEKAGVYRRVDGQGEMLEPYVTEECLVSYSYNKGGKKGIAQGWTVFGRKVIVETLARMGFYPKVVEKVILEF